MKRKYTVILMYPDYATDDYGETWCGIGWGRTVKEAVRNACRTCKRDNTRSIRDANDLRAVSVFVGEHRDLVGEWYAK